MIPHRDAADVHREQQHPGRGCVAPLPAPEQAEPADHRDRKRGHGVDFGLVGVLPVGERERANDGSSGRAADAEEPPRRAGNVAEGRRERLVHHEEEEARARCAQHRGEEVGAPGKLADRKERPPDVRHHDEQRCTRRVRDAQDLRGGDQLARIPEGHGGCQGQHETEEHNQRHGDGESNGRTGVEGVGHRLAMA